MTTSFVQGRLRNEPLSIEVISECAQSGEPIRLTIGSDFSYRSAVPQAGPLLFEPQVNWDEFAGPNIIDAY